MSTGDRHTVEQVAAAAHEHVLAALEDPEGDGAAAVAWCSAHLAAADGVLYAEAGRRATGAGDRLRAARAADRRLQHAANRFDRRLSGDTHLEQIPVEHLAADVREALDEHVRAERGVLAALAGALSDDEDAQLAEQLTSATADAPTRPHPHVPHTPAAGLVGRLEAFVDRARDVMDNRLVATGHLGRPPRPLGRWGAYLMGVQGPRKR